MTTNENDRQVNGEQNASQDPAAQDAAQPAVDNRGPVDDQQDRPAEGLTLAEMEAELAAPLRAAGSP